MNEIIINDYMETFFVTELDEKIIIDIEFIMIPSTTNVQDINEFILNDDIY